jgi:hypothetical protein
MEAIDPVAAATDTPTPRRIRDTRTPAQPLTVIDIPGAQLKLKTLAAISGRSMATLMRHEKAGLLKLTRNGARCTRVRSEDARAYLQALARGAA